MNVKGRVKVSGGGTGEVESGIRDSGAWVLRWHHHDEWRRTGGMREKKEGSAHLGWNRGGGMVFGA
eukprot:2394933-Rhodomonas_salina.1